MNGGNRDKKRKLMQNTGCLQKTDELEGVCKRRMQTTDLTDKPVSSSINMGTGHRFIISPIQSRKARLKRVFFNNLREIFDETVNSANFVSEGIYVQRMKRNFGHLWPGSVHRQNPLLFYNIDIFNYHYIYVSNEMYFVWI